MAGNWEYYVMKNGGQESELTKALDEKGAEGWELVQVNAPFYYFKRPKAVRITGRITHTRG
jgi:hypothetical protein